MAENLPSDDEDKLRQSKSIDPFFSCVHICVLNLLFSPSVRQQLKALKHQISELSKRNYELERDVRFFDQRIGLLIHHKKAVEVRAKHQIKRGTKGRLCCLICCQGVFR